MQGGKGCSSPLTGHRDTDLLRRQVKTVQRAGEAPYSHLPAQGRARCVVISPNGAMGLTKHRDASFSLLFFLLLFERGSHYVIGNPLLPCYRESFAVLISIQEGLYL